MKTGIQYWTWFDYGSPGQGINGEGWSGLNGVNIFRLSEKTGSLSFTPAGPHYYSSCFSDTHDCHARHLTDIGIDFLIFDQNNFTADNHPIAATCDPKHNPIFQASLKTMDGFWQNTRQIQFVHMLPLAQGDPDPIYVYPGIGEPYVRWHIEYLANRNNVHRSKLFHVTDPRDGKSKPLLLFYVHTGVSICDPRTREPRYFQGPGSVIPARWQFQDKEKITVDHEEVLICDVFTVRFATYAAVAMDYRDCADMSHEIWPFDCFDRVRGNDRTQFDEVAYASCYARSEDGHGRRIEYFRDWLLHAAGKEHLVIRCWNEFSSTDENAYWINEALRIGVANAFTLEPNNQLHKYDQDHKEDPWYYFCSVKALLQARREHPTDKVAFLRRARELGVR